MRVPSGRAVFHAAVLLTANLGEGLGLRVFHL